MKNFRKVLALILVVAVLFSFAAMASAKTTEDYTDAASVDYTEAVDVLSAIGILDGYTDGSFQPTKNIQREEMAKMVAVLSNAGSDVSELYASACTFADSKNSWAASYIAYCAQLGIVAGRSATTFDPDANVTGIETAKMLLCVLGLDADQQGYVGSSWKTNVLRDAKEFGLLNGFAADYDVAAAITREEAAQMFLNALLQNIVIGYISNNIVTITNAAYYPHQAPTLTTIKDAEKKGEVVLYGNAIVTLDPLYTIFSGLEFDPFEQDCYGRPGHAWSLDDAKGNNLFYGLYIDDAEVKTEYVDLATELKAEIASKRYDVTLYVDGLPVDNYKDATLNNGVANAIANAYTGRGVETQIFVDDAWASVIIVVKNTYIDYVTKTSERYSTFTLSNGKVYSNKGYDFAVGDVVLYWLCNGACQSKSNYNYNGLYLHDAEKVEPVVATVSKTVKNNVDTRDSYFVAGETYEYALNYLSTYADGLTATVNPADRDPLGAVNDILGVSNVKGTYAIYTDKYGYVMLVTAPPAAPTYFVYAVENSWTVKYSGTVTATDNGVTQFADLVDFNAEYSEDVAIDHNFLYRLTTAFDQRYVGLLVGYQLNADGEAEITVEAKEAPLDSYLQAGSGNIVNSVDGKIGNDDDATIVTSNDYTKYLIRTFDFTTGAYKYEAVEGYRNLSDSYLGTIFNDDPSKVKDHASLQYIDLDGDKIAEYIFVDAAYTLAANYFYVLGDAESVSDAQYWDYIKGYNVYRAVVNGEESFVATTRGGETPLQKNVLYKGSLASIELIDGKVLYILVEPQTDLKLIPRQLGAVSGGKIQLDLNADNQFDVDEWFNLAADVKAVLIRDADVYPYAEPLTYEELEKLSDDAEYHSDKWMIEAYYVQDPSGEITQLYVLLRYTAASDQNPDAARP